MTDPIPFPETTRNLRTELSELFDTPLLFLDSPHNADEAILGVLDRPSETPFVVYDRGKLITQLADEFRASDPEYVSSPAQAYEDAEEYLEFNTFSAWVGPHTPGFLHLNTLTPSPLWVVGCVIPDTDKPHPADYAAPEPIRWSIIGIYTDHERAKQYCATPYHFLAPFPLDAHPLDDTLESWPGLEWPNV